MEEKGIILEKLDEISGIILGNDQIEYYFETIDYLEDQDIQIGQKVMFKKEIYLTEKEPFYKATMISNEEEIIS